MTGLRSAVLLGALLGCDGLPTTTDTGIDEGPLRQVTEDLRTNASGKVTLQVEVTDGDTAFQVSADTGPKLLPSLQSVRGPDGKKVLDWEELLSSPRSVTNAIFPLRSTTAFNWPIQKDDGPLAPGTWTLTWSVIDEDYFPESRAPVALTTALKRDPDETVGEVHVRILWADGLGGQPKVVNAVADATEHWREIWANHGITLVERYAETNLDSELAFYQDGSAAVETVSEQKEDGELQLIVGDTIDRDLYLYGVAAGIPGTIQVSPSTYVVMSWLSHAGPDAKFDADEIGLMGETMAHEIGHYTGLYHPVESGYGRWDSLDDTPECESAFDCQDDLGKNLMFPYSLCTRTECINQTQLTRNQTEVLQTFVGAL